MTPYYDDGQCVIYHGDCREILPTLEFDVIVTDPPYGRAWKQGETAEFNGWRSNKHDGIQGDTDTSARDEVLAAVDVPCVVFGDLMLPPPPDTKICLIFDKGNEAGMFGAVAGFRRSAEAIYLIGKWPSGFGGERGAVLRSLGSTGGNLTRSTGHPHTKPRDVMQQLVAVTEGTVADPFMGSGTTLRAAKDLGRSAIGIEIEERYCEIAAKRLAQGVLDFGAVS